jgi:NAD+-dependent protein deacetylase sirtuin 2
MDRSKNEAKKRPNSTSTDALPRIVDMKSLAEFIKHPKCRSIVMLTGAGVSVASGIPDFRSPGGMSSTLRPELLSATQTEREALKHDPTLVVSWNLFRHTPLPYMEVRRPFILGSQNEQWKATIAHRFAELLHTKTMKKKAKENNNIGNKEESKLTRVYTQNIDGLYHQCEDLPSSKVVNVHGSISNVACEGCGSSMDFDVCNDKVRAQIKDIYNIDLNAPAESTTISCQDCDEALVKPTTLLFGHDLPSKFFEC